MSSGVARILREYAERFGDDRAGELSQTLTKLNISTETELKALLGELIRERGLPEVASDFLVAAAKAHENDAPAGAFLDDIALKFGRRFGDERAARLRQKMSALGISTETELGDRLGELELPEIATDFLTALGNTSAGRDSDVPVASAHAPAVGLDAILLKFGARFGDARADELGRTLSLLEIETESELKALLDGTAPLPLSALGVPGIATDFLSSCLFQNASSNAQAAVRASARASAEAAGDDLSASIDRPPRRTGVDRALLRALGYGRGDEDPRGEYGGTKLSDHMDDLNDVIAKLSRTIEEWRRHDPNAQRNLSQPSDRHWKQRRLTWGFWNYTREVVQLEQALAVARVLQAEQSRLVPVGALLEVARRVSPLTRNVRDKCRSGRESGGTNDTFKPWLRQMLYPAVLFYDLDAADSQQRSYAFAHPHGVGAQTNLAECVKSVSTQRSSSDVRATLGRINIAGYLKALPLRSHKRVLRSLLADLCQSRTFLKTKFGINPMSSSFAQTKVHAAFAVLGDIETRTQTVSSNLTTAGSRRKERLDFDRELGRMLADDHGGGNSLVEKTEKLGVDFHRLIEMCAEELGRHNYGGENLTGEMATNAARDSTVGQRDCSWKALANRVEEKIRAKQPPGETPITVGESTVRRHCVARCVRSLHGQARHVGDAQVSTQRLKSSVSDSHPDAHISCAVVMLAEEALFELAKWLADHGVRPLVLYRLWDDHAKWSANQKRGFDRHRTVQYRKAKSNAPTSDMGMKVGGGKATTNSILTIAPVGVYPREVEEAWQTSTKRNEPCHKQAYAVTRLEMEKRSTPTQQINDWRYVQHSDAQLAAVTTSGAFLFSVADCGWDHSVRNEECQYMITVDHLKVRSPRGFAQRKPISPQ